jgi:hypothetical protein
VGIHPLEAMAAALVGYPLAGFLGSFLAVPMVGLVHVLARQGYASWKAREAASADSEESVAQLSSDAPALPPGGSMGAEAYAATGSRQ